jgi:CheY-like chemotaxis protein
MIKTLLLADRDPLLVADYCHILERRSFEVHTAVDGLECLAKLQDVRPDVLLLEHDLLWGGSEGVLALIGTELSIPDVPVVLIGGEAMPDELSSLVAPPVVACLRKPFRIRALLDLLASLDSNGFVTAAPT